MANSFVRLIYHCIWSTKNREPLIAREMEERLWAYVAGIAQENRVHPLQIGGIENHLHILIEVPKEKTLPEVIKQLKGGSSAWLNRARAGKSPFRWQDGYGAFTVSSSSIVPVAAYIARQREHHQHRTFEQEYAEFLAKHGVKFDERYLLG